MPERKNYKGSQSPKYQEKLRNARLCHNDKSIIHLPGNICRSPMAEFIFKDIVRRVGLADQFEIASAATSREEIWHGKGNPVYPPAKAELAAHGLSCDGKCARQLTVADYDYYDLLLAMDGSNVRNLHRMLGGDPQHKIKKLLDYAHGGDVADPWYSRDFARAYQDIATGCRALLTALTTK